MAILVLALAILAAIVLVLARTILEDGYGRRPPPRSHRAEEQVDSWGLPLQRPGRPT